MSLRYKVLGDSRTATPADMNKVIDLIKRYGNMKAYPVHGMDDTIEVPKPISDYATSMIRNVWQDVQPVA